jgi:hypothetical protein
MKKMLALSVAAALFLSACGGGGGDTSATASVAKTMKLSFYGNPLQSNTATAHFAVAHASAATDSAASDAAAQTVQSLSDALAAKGVPSTVTAQVMDGTTLHGIVMGENNGLPPTPDQFGKDPSEWLIVNFALDDMVTPLTDPVQAASITQFKNDLIVFTQRAAVSGKQVFVVVPITPCDESALTRSSAAEGLYGAESQASNVALTFLTGDIGGNTLSYPQGLPILSNAVTAGHMGADCRTPDAYLQNLRTQAIAMDIATRYNLIGKTPA